MSRVAVVTDDPRAEPGAGGAARHFVKESGLVANQALAHCHRPLQRGVGRAKLVGDGVLEA